MEEYIDIHSHILPGIDDGSQNAEQTLAMLRIAYSEGIRTIIATPHYRIGWCTPILSELEEGINETKKVMETKLPGMTLFLGSEIYYSHKCMDQLKLKNISTLAGSRYILVEFSSAAEYRYIKNAVQELLVNGFRPILAHIERYADLTRNIRQVEEVIKMGAYIQVNARSITGENGYSYKRLSKRLLKYKLVHFVATDSHNDRMKSPRLKRCALYLSKKYGEEYAKELLVENQKKVIANQYI